MDNAGMAIDIELAYNVGKIARTILESYKGEDSFKEFQACCFCGYWILQEGLQKGFTAHKVMREVEE